MFEIAKDALNFEIMAAQARARAIKTQEATESESNSDEWNVEDEPICI